MLIITTLDESVRKCVFEDNNKITETKPMVVSVSSLLTLKEAILIWVKVFKNRLRKICGRQPKFEMIWSVYVKAVFQKFWSVHSWIPWNICSTKISCTENLLQNFRVETCSRVLYWRNVIGFGAAALLKQESVACFFCWEFDERTLSGLLACGYEILYKGH